MRTGTSRIAPAFGVLLCLSLPASASAAIPLGDPDAPSRSGRTLTSDNGSWICFGCSFSYAWERCTPGCSTIPGAGGPAYVLSTPDIGATIRSRVTATDGGGSATRTSASTATIAAAPPVNVSPPIISGTPRVGSTMTSTAGAWDDPSPSHVDYRREWVRCTTIDAGSCVAVSTAATYVPGGADVGHFIRRREIAEGLGAATAFSMPIGMIANTPVVLQGVPFPSIGGGSANRRAGARRLRPFPVVVIAGRVRRGRTVIRTLLVKGPRRAQVRLRCRGRGCPFARIVHTIGRRKRVRVRGAERTYRAGNVVEIRITGRDRIGKFTRLRFRSRGAPARRDLCLQPGARRPSRCPN